jgi:hypothetical protein
MSIANVINTSKCQRGGLSPETGRNCAQAEPEAGIHRRKYMRLNKSGIAYRHDDPSVEAGSARIEILEAVRTFDVSHIRWLENGSMGQVAPFSNMTSVR